MVKNLLTVVFCAALLIAPCGVTEVLSASLYETVDQALEYSPRLKQLQYNREAVAYDLKQSRGAYLPSIDFGLGYGLDQQSDISTRSDGADPDDNDWDIRGEASLGLTQKLYDGGETKQQIAVRKALLTSADHRVHDNAQAIALDAIIAHLDVYRQSELVALSDNSLNMHRDILASLQELRRAGAGSIADVTQVQGRMARVAASLAAAKADLASAIGRYKRIVGQSPQDVGFAGLPMDVPQSLEQSLSETEAGNPKVLALTADNEEAASRVKLARSNHKPRINLELNTDYTDQAEGDPSWEHSSEAMVRLRWNLYNGGQDKAAINAAESRRLQSVSARNEQLTEALEETNTTWAQLSSAEMQIDAYRGAVDYNQETLESYLQQFNVAQRSLLDVLDAANEYYQTSGQLVTSATNKTIAAYRLLALSGRLKVSEDAGTATDVPDYLKTLRQPVSVQQSARLAPLPAVERPEAEEVFGLSDEDRAGVNDFVLAWVESWRSKDVANYLNCYSENLVPARGRNLTQWRSFRTRFLTMPDFIEINLGDLLIEAVEDGNARVTFEQAYSSNLYNDKVQKSLLLEPVDGSWKIIREIPDPL